MSHRDSPPRYGGATLDVSAMSPRRCYDVCGRRHGMLEDSVSMYNPYEGGNMTGKTVRKENSK
eukprot:53973-Eustigmatos_ZCMA.PRE.1